MKLNLYRQCVERLCKKYIRQNYAVFDCGCGDGHTTSVLKKYSKKVIGGDLENRTIKNLGIKFRQITVNNYGKENEFDVVVSFDVIEHVKNDAGFLNEVIKITKPGGIIVIGTPNRNRLSNIIMHLLGVKITYPRRLGYHYESGGEIIHFREYRKNDLKKLIISTKKVNILELKTLFLGAYLGGIPVGIKNTENEILPEYSQHIFAVFQKSKYDKNPK